MPPRTPTTATAATGTPGTPGAVVIQGPVVRVARGSYSDYIALPGGNGEYIMMVNKTSAGARNFDLEWHCYTATNAHTGTDVTVQQFQ